MKNRDIAFIACRVLSLWLFVQTFVGLATLVSLFPDYLRVRDASLMAVPPELRQLYASFVMLAVSLAVQVACGVILWVKSSRIAAAISVGTEDQNDMPLDRSGAMRLVVAALGLFALLTTAPKVAVSLLMAQRTDWDFLRGTGPLFAFLVNVITVTLGILAVIKNRMIAQFVMKDPGQPCTSPLDRKEGTQQSSPCDVATRAAHED